MVLGLLGRLASLSAQESGCAIPPEYSGSYNLFLEIRPGEGSSMNCGRVERTLTCSAENANLRFYTPYSEYACGPLSVYLEAPLGHLDVLTIDLIKYEYMEPEYKAVLKLKGRGKVRVETYPGGARIVIRSR